MPFVLESTQQCFKYLYFSPPRAGHGEGQLLGSSVGLWQKVWEEVVFVLVLEDLMQT